MISFGLGRNNGLDFTNWNVYIVLGWNVQDIDYTQFQMWRNIWSIMDGIQVRVWKGLGNKDSSNEEWEEHFRVLARQQTQGLDFAIDMRVMVVDAF